MNKKEFLESIVGYLPYKLQTQVYYKSDIWYLSGVNFKTEILELSKYRDGLYTQVNWKAVKPLLYPMSKLTKEITVDGETFVPMDKIRELFIEDKNKCCFIYRESFEDLYDWNLETTKQKCKMLSYEWVQLFYKWMLDVNDLIGQGLAIEKK